MKKIDRLNRGTLDKLPYILLELLNDESPESVDYIIARYILENIENLSGDSIQDIADACEVSKSTLSRFCRKAGLEDFQEMKDELHDVVFSPDNIFNVPVVDENGKGYLRRVSEQVLELDKTLDYGKVNKLVEEIYSNPSVLLLGSMQAMTPAVNLQQDLFAAGKVTRVPAKFSLQINAIDRAKPKDLMVCFSNSGIFFERLLMSQGDIRKLNDTRIWMITGNKNVKNLPYVDEIIYIPDNHTYVSHPLQFDLTARVIAMSYAEYVRKLNKSLR